MNCNNYFDMTDQGDSFETWQGLRGPAGPQGPAGAPGAPGTSVELRGPVETTGDLPATASSSELWLVGSAAPYHGWFYNGSSWEDAGEIAVGPTGPQGPAGQDGTDGSNGVTFTPAVSSAGVISWTNDGGLPNPDSVNIKGPQGATGATGPAGPGVPAGGTAGQSLKKQSATDYATGWQTEDLGISGASVDDFVKIAAVDANGKPTAFGKGTPGGGDVTADMLGIVIDGNSTAIGASAGQYVIVKNSTISGITDGLYTAAQAIPANTAIDATYLTAVSGGGLNDLNKKTNFSIGRVMKQITISNDTYTVDTIDVTKPGKKAIFATFYGADESINFFITRMIFSYQQGGISSVQFTVRYIPNTGSLAKVTKSTIVSFNVLYIDE